MASNDSIEILHLSDIQFGKNHWFGQSVADGSTDVSFDTLSHRLAKDITTLKKDHGIAPQIVVVSGDLAEWALKKEFDNAYEFLTKLCQDMGVSSDRIVIVPGNHDINRKLCEGYFATCAGEELEPVKPYWPKWKHFDSLFQRFYESKAGICFTETEPWTLYEMPDLKVVVAAMNSTMAESHLDTDHYGFIGERQIHWFENRLQQYKDDGWFRLGVVHHNVERGAELDDENLRDADIFKQRLGPLLNCVLHGHIHKDGLGWIDGKVPVISTGSAALKSAQRPDSVRNQYQVLRFFPDQVQRFTRCYDSQQKRWIGDTRCSPSGDAWVVPIQVQFESVGGVFPQNRPSPQPEALSDFENGRSLVQIDKPIDRVRAGQSLKSLPRFQLRVEEQHRRVREIDHIRLSETLKSRRSAWLISDWGLGKEGFLACALLRTNNAALDDVFRLHCGAASNCEQLLSEAENQLGLSFQEFFAAISALPSPVLVFDDLPPIIVTGAERDAFERKVRPIFDFCPTLLLIFIARQSPSLTNPDEIVTIHPLDIQETRDYLRNHTRARPGLDDEYDLERIHTWSGGLPMHLDRLLERLQFLSLSDVLSEDLTVFGPHAQEPVPESLKATVSNLDQPTNKHLARSFRLLKVLTILRDGETFQSVRRFDSSAPFNQAHVDELIRNALLENVPISQTAADLQLARSQSISTYSEPPKLLRVPRQVRDYVNTLISDDERDEIIRTSTGLFFGSKWWKGNVKIRTAITDAYGQSAIAGPGNENLVSRYLLSKSLEKGKSQQIKRFANLALGYCSKLEVSDRFRDVLIASSGLMELLRDTPYDEEYVHAAQMYSKALRMTNRHTEALLVGQQALERGADFIIDSNKARMLLNIALSHKALGHREDALAVAKNVLDLVKAKSDVAFQAEAIIAEVTLKGGMLTQRLVELEQDARNHDQNTSANNIALDLARNAMVVEDAIKLLDKVIASARDNYNRTRGIIDKATLLNKHSRTSELTEADHRLLSAAYSYSYGQRIGTLLDNCHQVLWSIFNKERLWSSLLRLFRYSSFVWRLRGNEESENHYLSELGVINVSEIKQEQGETLHIEILYLERRRKDSQMSIGRQ